MPDIETRADYEQYERDVAEFIEREAITHLSTGTHDLADGALVTPGDEPDPWFSWRPCDCCGCHLSGNREYHRLSVGAG